MPTKEASVSTRVGIPISYLFSIEALETSVCGASMAMAALAVKVKVFFVDMSAYNGAAIVER